MVNRAAILCTLYFSSLYTYGAETREVTTPAYDDCQESTYPPFSLYSSSSMQIRVGKKVSPTYGRDRSSSFTERGSVVNSESQTYSLRDWENSSVDTGTPDTYSLSSYEWGSETDTNSLRSESSSDSYVLVPPEGLTFQGIHFLPANDLKERSAEKTGEGRRFSFNGPLLRRVSNASVESQDSVRSGAGATRAAEELIGEVSGAIARDQITRPQTPAPLRYVAGGGGGGGATLEIASLPQTARDVTSMGSQESPSQANLRQPEGKSEGKSNEEEDEDSKEEENNGLGSTENINDALDAGERYLKNDLSAPETHFLRQRLIEELKEFSEEGYPYLSWKMGYLKYLNGKSNKALKIWLASIKKHKAELYKFEKMVLYTGVAFFKKGRENDAAKFLEKAYAYGSEMAATYLVPIYIDKINACMGFRKKKRQEEKVKKLLIILNHLPDENKSEQHEALRKELLEKL